jgi:SPP1 gp7 family putative phage head morphogenesis protein
MQEKKLLVSTIRKASNVFANRHIKVVARMESVTVANQQRLEACRKSKIIKGVQFMAVVDKRTTQICRARHNHILPLESSYLAQYTPPCHFNCRSLLSPVTIYETDLEYTSISTLSSVPAPFSDNKKTK